MGSATRQPPVKPGKDEPRNRGDSPRDHDTFAIGRVLARVDGVTTMHVYDPPRTIVDTYRMRAKLGPAVAHDALRRWLSLNPWINSIADLRMIR